MKAIVAVPSLLIEDREAVSTNGFVFKFLFIVFLVITFPNNDFTVPIPPAPLFPVDYDTLLELFY